MGKSYIYLDYNATTPVDGKVLNAMLPWFSTKFANPSSKDHPMGQQAAKAVNLARKQIGKAISAKENDIIFTSGATESLNLAIRGLFSRYGQQKNHIITFKTEHKAVLATIESLTRKGAEISILDVNGQGEIDLDLLEDAILPNTLFIAAMWVNNETGVIHPVADISKICRKKDVRFICDATQALGKIDINLEKVHLDFMAFSGHKIYGPKGIGGLFMNSQNSKTSLHPLITGGGQEFGLRSGTLNVPAIVGLGQAVQEITNNSESVARIQQLRNHLENVLKQCLDVRINGESASRVANVVNVEFKGIRNKDLIRAIDLEMAVATGSSCNSSQVLPSHVLKAMGRSDREAFSSIRISLGKYTTLNEIERAIEILTTVVLKLQKAPSAL